MVSSTIIPLIFFPTVGLAGFVFNAILLVSVWRSTPKALSNYAVLIANYALIDMIAASACILTIPRQIASLSTFILIFHGPCGMLGAPLCRVGFSLLIYSLLLSYFLLCASFAFRFYVLTKGQLRKKRVTITLIVVNGINFFVAVSLFAEFTHTDISSILLSKDARIPKEVPLLIIGVIDISKRIVTQLTLLYVASVSLLVFPFCFLIQRRIIFYLDENKALRLQLVISFIASMGSSLLLLSIFEIIREPFLDYLQPAINCSVLFVSPLVNITFVKPYREYVLQNLLKLHPAKIISPTVPAWSTTIT